MTSALKIHVTHQQFAKTFLEVSFAHVHKTWLAIPSKRAVEIRMSATQMQIVTIQPLALNQNVSIHATTPLNAALELCVKFKITKQFARVLPTQSEIPKWNVNDLSAMTTINVLLKINA
jgi:hypothetical protein